MKTVKINNNAQSFVLVKAALTILLVEKKSGTSIFEPICFILILACRSKKKPMCHFLVGPT